MGVEELYVQIVNLSFFRLILAAVILIFTGVLARTVIFILKKREQRDSKHSKANKTQFSFLRHMVVASIYLIGIAVAISVIPALENLAVSLFAGAGVAALVIGFASQKAVSNIVSGLFIAIFKPFRIGDLVSVQNITGYIEDITLRHTIIKDFESVRHIIPNSILSDETITNNDLVEDEKCKHYEIGISYESDVEKALSILKKEAEKHPLCRDHRSAKQKKDKVPKVKVEIIKLDESSVNLRAWIWVHNSTDEYQVSWDLNRALKKKFDEAGINIPYPQRTVHIKK